MRPSGDAKIAVSSVGLTGTVVDASRPKSSRTQRELEAASHSFTEVQADHQAYGFEWGDAFCDFFLGSSAWFAGDMTQAYKHSTRSLEILRRVGDLTMMAWTLLRLANLSIEIGETAEAQRLLVEAQTHL